MPHEKGLAGNEDLKSYTERNGDNEKRIKQSIKEK